VQPDAIKKLGGIIIDKYLRMKNNSGIFGIYESKQ